ncbi:MAG TPA: hypothetical protein VMN56_03580 [Casimicrobiaceae bacterium]|nr:hypothetical protein [Casimicrobiaceae bacterium]
MPHFISSTSEVGSRFNNTAVAHKRVGLVAARIGADLQHQLGVEISTDRGPAPVGAIVQLTVADVTRFPDEADSAKWVCRTCKTFHKSKRELLAAHRPNKDLMAAGEVHVYHAIFESPAVAEVRDAKTGEIKTKAAPARAMLLSDEE